VLQGLWKDSTPADGSGIPVFAAGTADDIANINSAG